MKETTLAEALAERGYRHEKSKIEGKREIYDSMGRHVGSFDAQEAWAMLQIDAEMNWIRNEDEAAEREFRPTRRSGQ